MSTPAENQQTVEALAAAIAHWVREQMSPLSTPQSRTDAKIAGRAALRDLVAQAAGARAGLEQIASMPTSEFNPDGDEQAAYSMQLVARDALARLDGAP